MTTQESVARTSAGRTSGGRTSGVMAALRRPLPPSYRYTIYATVLVMIPGMVSVIASGADEPRWPWPLLPTLLALVTAIIILGLAGGRRALAAARVTQAALYLLVLVSAWRWTSAADAPLWVQATIYGGTAVILTTTALGTVATYRDLKRDRSDASAP